MSRSIYTCRPLMAILLLAGLGLAGTAPAAADASTSPAPAVATRPADPQWAISPGRGPSAGGTTVTLTQPEAGRFTQVSAKSSHSSAITSDGNLYTWGKNNRGQLGRDTGGSDRDENPAIVAKPAGVDTWTQTGAGAEHSIAIGSDGNLYTWGDNNHSQLGRDTGSATKDANPGMVAKPAGVDTWTQAITGNRHSMAIGSDGNLYTWGDNYYGQLGRGTDWEDENPGMVAKPAGVDTWTQIGIGSYHSMAIGSDGNLYTWGDNYYRQLGRGTTISTDRPGKVNKPAGVDTWTQAGTGNYHSLAIGSDGNLYTWGDNSQDQLGR
ncbi:RCC1 domain-containing protein, partial [Bifidobacterium favimelis]